MSKPTSINIPLELQPYIRQVWMIEPGQLKAEGSSLTVFADGCPGILFHQSEQGLIMNETQRLPPLFLYGQTVEPARIECPQGGHMIVLNFHSHVMPSLFGFSAKEITDDCIDLHLLPAIPRISLSEQLFVSATPEKQLHLLFSFLQTLVRRNNSGVDKGVQYAIEQIQQAGGDLQLKQLQRELNITERTFERRFEQFVGVSPKLFSKIVRFQGSLRQLISKRFKKLSDIAYDNGYADQSHFIRQFKSFTGLSPLEFHRQSHNLYGNFPAVITDL